MIGSALVRKLNDLGKIDLILVDDLKRGEKWKNLLGKEFLEIVPKEKLFDWLVSKESEIETIFHLGACSDTTETNSDYLLENNTRYTIRLAKWALSHNIRFIYASSAATYGDGSLGFSDDEERLKELKPLNMYGFSKQLVDLWMQRENVLQKVVGLKYFNVFGPNEYHKGKMASMVLKMSHVADKKGEISLFQSNDKERYLDGGQMRDFIYVKDAVAMTALFADPKHRSIGGIFNIGRGEPVTWNRLASALFKALVKPEKIIYVEMPEELKGQYQNYTCADMRKFQSTFSSEKMRTTPIEAAVQEYVQEYLVKNERW